MRTKLTGLAAALVGALAFTPSIARAADPLPSWNDVASKQTPGSFNLEKIQEMIEAGATGK